MTAPPAAPARASVLALLAFLAFVSLGLPDGLLGVAWPSMRGDFGVPLDALGVLAATQTAGYLTASFLSGRLLRVMPIGTVLALSTLAAAAALLGFAAAPAWPALLGFAVLAGLGGGAVDAGLNAYGARHFSARILNWLHACFGVGTTLGPLIVTAVLGAGQGWRWSYVLVGTAQLGLALTFFLTRRRWAGSASAGAAPAPDPARTRDTLRRPVVWLGMLTFFVYTGVEVVAAQWSYSLMTLERGVPPAQAGLAVSLYWGSLMAGRILFGTVAHRVPLVATLRACLVTSVVGALLFWLEPTPSLAVAGLMLIGGALAPVFASLVSLTPGRVGGAHADSAIGFQVAAAGLGGAALTALVGVLSRWGGLEVIGLSVTVLAALLLALYEGFVRVGGEGVGPGQATTGPLGATQVPDRGAG
ncbi:MFS transporter [Deinococcus sp. RL]|uniref:MFS transporter n=1 Tax=Deinococcus sp. RL TaxID=1489678 RepID=UPI0004D664DF|nr:MFS transporter [Deinococcus sp. RL]KEF33580.1 MFS transporter [Deinococcus sp. RL]